MKQNLWKRLIAMWCVGSLLMTAPATNVLADDIQQETNVSEMIDDSTSVSEISDDHSGKSFTAEEMQEDEEEVYASESDESVEDAYHAADESEKALNNAADDSAEASDSDADDSAEVPNNAEDNSVDTEPIEEDARDDSSVAEDTSVILEAEDSSVEELVGANTWTVGNGVTAKIVKKDNENILYFTSKGGTLWNNWKSKIGNAVSTVNTITFTADSTKMYFPEDSSELFDGDALKNIKRIDLKKADTSKVKSMKGMFDDCYEVSNLDVSGFDTSNVTNMEAMFCACNLTNIDVSGFKTSKVTNMKDMFNYCNSLTNLDVSGFDTSNVTDMKRMFFACSALTNLDLSNFKTSRVTDMEEMFRWCDNLITLDVSGFDTSNVTNMKNMFDCCFDLKNLDVSGFNTSNVTNMEEMFCACSDLTNIDVSGFKTSKVTDMSNMFESCYNLRNLDLSRFDTSNVKNMNSMFFYCEKLTSLDVSGFKTSNVSDMSEMFRLCTNLTNLDVSGFDTSKVTDMSYMFNDCSKLNNLNVSGFDTSNVTDMRCMFDDCNNLSNLDISRFDTSKVINMGSMFSGCYKLTNLDVSGFDTSNLKITESMFYCCRGLKNLNVSGFNTSKVTDMNCMFKGCTGLTNLDVSNFITSSVQDMKGMFEDCCGLKTLDVSAFNTSKVTNMNSMFKNCTELKALDVSSFNTSKVKDLDYMFKNCSSITSLDLSSFYILDRADTYTITMLINCTNLQILKTPKRTFDDLLLPAIMYDSTGKVYQYLTKISESILLRRKVRISERDITLSQTSYTFDGNTKEPTVTVKCGDTVLKMGTDYTVNYKNNVDVGTATATITGKGFYGNTISKNFTIKQALPGQVITIKNAKITGINRSYGYTGSTYTPNFKVVLNKKTLTANTDYTYTFEDNTNPGVAKLIINGKGTYHDKLIYEFVIVNCVAKPVVGKTYMLVPKNNPYGCLCTQGGKMVNNTKASITDQSSSESVKIVLKKSSDGNYKFMSAKCELVLAVQQNSTELGRGVVFYQNTTKTAQNWKLYRKADNSWAIVNAVTGYSIATPTATADKGSAFIIAKTAASSLQRFYFVETSPVRPRYDGTYSLRAARNKDYSVDIIDGSTYYWVDAVLYKYSGTNSQKFTAIYSGGGYYRLVNKKSGLVLAVWCSEKDDGVSVCQETWAGLSGQRWKFTENSDGTVTLTSGLGTVLHLHTNTIKNGMYIKSRLPADTTAQRWFLIKA